MWIGFIFLLAGAAVMFASITTEIEDVTAPRWKGFSFGLMFFNAGITVGLMNAGFNDVRGNKWFLYTHLMILLSIPFIFLMLLNWIAFGPGEREFSMSVSIPFMAVDFNRASEIIGRIIFGIPALIIDAILLCVTCSGMKYAFKKREYDDK